MASRKPRIDVRRKPTLRKGPVKHSKRVNDRIKAAGALRGSVEEFKAEAAAGFSDRLAGELRDGEVVPDQSVALELAVRTVTTALEELVDADDEYCRKMMRRQHLEKACQAFSALEVYPRVRDLRANLESLFGRKEGRALHGMRGPTRRKPKRLHPQLRALVPRLKSQRRALPLPRLAGVTVDRDAWVGQVEPGYKQLSRMLEELQQREIGEEYQRKVRDIELEDFDAVYGEALDFVRSVFRLAGYGDRVIWHLLPNVDRRRLKREARGEREARADGRRGLKDDPDRGPAGGGPPRVA